MRALLLAAALLGASTAAADPDLAAGAAVWTKRCASCHGADGKGDTKVGKKYKVADLSDPSWPLAWTAPRVRKVIEDGVQGQMPAWKEKLSPAEIEAVTAYVFTLSKPAKK